VSEFGDALAALAQDMVETMYFHNGIGLAAPQIGLGKRLFVAAETAEADEEPDDAAPPATAAEKRRRWGVVKEHVLVNPQVLEQGGLQHGPDGCLSMPGLFVDELPRAYRLRLRYQDVTGAPRELEAEGRFAHVLQHELDHLNGVLFFDHLPDAERRAFLAEHRSTLAQMQRDAKAFLKERRGNERWDDPLRAVR
jgi:peptide deformylase